MDFCSLPTQKGIYKQHNQTNNNSNCNNKTNNIFKPFKWEKQTDNKQYNQKLYKSIT